MVKNRTSAAVSSTAADYLACPYTRTIVPQDDGSYLAEIAEFPGCIATGFSVAEAYNELEEVAASWIEAALAANQTIPSAIEDNDFSGKIVLRMPRSLHKKASFSAERDGVSLNQFLVACIAECVGASTHKNTNLVSYTMNNLSVFNVTPVPSGQYSLKRVLTTAPAEIKSYA